MKRSFNNKGQQQCEEDLYDIIGRREQEGQISSPTYSNENVALPFQRESVGAEAPSVDRSDADVVRGV